MKIYYNWLRDKSME